MLGVSKQNFYGRKPPKPQMSIKDNHRQEKHSFLRWAAPLCSTAMTVLTAIGQMNKKCFFGFLSSPRLWIWPCTLTARLPFSCLKYLRIHNNFRGRELHYPGKHWVISSFNRRRKCIPRCLSEPCLNCNSLAWEPYKPGCLQYAST